MRGCHWRIPAANPPSLTTKVTTLQSPLFTKGHPTDALTQDFFETLSQALADDKAI